ncbi:MAG: hypothetical protein NTZ90_07885 [Proteobacteria bacterium]|nr:hypothetical protein [Pseudomonadota bacterium]
MDAWVGVISGAPAKTAQQPTGYAKDLRVLLALDLQGGEVSAKQPLVLRVPAPLQGERATPQVRPHRSRQRRTKVVGWDSGCGRATPSCPLLLASARRC